MINKDLEPSITIEPIGSMVVSRSVQYLGLKCLKCPCSAMRYHVLYQHGKVSVTTELMEEFDMTVGATL